MRLATALLLLLSMPVIAANPWLCIGEYGASVTDYKSQVTGSDSFTNSQKFLINDEGFRIFGDEYAIISTCMWIDGRPTHCQDGETRVDEFSMGPNLVFTLIRLAGEEIDGELKLTHYILKGKCSKL